MATMTRSLDILFELFSIRDYFIRPQVNFYFVKSKPITSFMLDFPTKEYIEQ